MAITAADIHNMSFGIDRKGYDVDEVDVFLEHVADEIDALNNQVEELESQLDESRFSGFDTPAHASTVDFDEKASLEPDEETTNLLAEKDARIAELEKKLEEVSGQLEAKKADDSAISQVLINAQRMADDTVAAAKTQAASIVDGAHAEAKQILDDADQEKQSVIDAIQKLEDDREDAREEYQELLKDFISDATRKLADIGESSVRTSAHARVEGSVPARPATDSSAAITGQVPVQVPVSEGSYYMTPQMGGAVVAPAEPVPSPVEKDLSGFGDTDDNFEFDDID